MPDDVLIATNPGEGTTLPYLVRIPLGPAMAPWITSWNGRNVRVVSPS